MVSLPAPIDVVTRMAGAVNRWDNREVFVGYHCGLRNSGMLTFIASTSSPSSVPRGPPRKPKQSGHALWVGNLPPGTNVVDLKEHFSRDATEDILSVFLISKSNCAFVNYKTEGSCAASMTRFHDSRFQGVRLVCRLRRTSANAAPGVPTGPAALIQSPPNIPPAAPVASSSGPAVVADSEPRSSASSTPQDKYFIVKSLTVEDLESSVKNGIWATQSHNEESLNKAYEVRTARNPQNEPN
jgi:RNA recognition motif-containing protein